MKTKIERYEYQYRVNKFLIRIIEKHYSGKPLTYNHCGYLS